MQVEPGNIPVNEEFFSYLQKQKRNGRSLTLISASQISQVKKIGDPMNLFDRIEGTRENINLKGKNKLSRIQELASNGKFGYAGNAAPDIPIWEAASQAILVNCTDTYIGKFDTSDKEVLQFDRVQSYLPEFLNALRPHQWLKNGLLYLPLLLSHQLVNLELLGQATIGFICFSLCASSVYLLNDMFDLDSDRRHRSKRMRPFASGALPLQMGFVAVPVLLIAAFSIAVVLPAGIYSLSTALLAADYRLQPVT